MLVITDLDSVARVAHPGIRGLIEARIRQLFPEGDCRFLDGEGLLVFEAGDTAADLDRVTGWPLLYDPFEHVPFGHSDFTPSFDYLEDLNVCYEIHWDTAGDGIDITAFIPKDDTGIDPRVLALCQAYARPAINPT